MSYASSLESSEPRIAVIGAGITGVTTAYNLARRGCRVTLFDRQPYAAMETCFANGGQAAAPWVSLLDDKTKIVTSRLGATRFRVAGTAEFNGFNRDIRAERIAPLVCWCRSHFPGMSTRHAVPWVGLRPMMPDMMPCVMQGKNPRVFYNTGHGHLGWTLPAATADAVSALATRRANAA